MLDQTKLLRVLLWIGHCHFCMDNPLFEITLTVTLSNSPSGGKISYNVLYSGVGSRNRYLHLQSPVPYLNRDCSGSALGELSPNPEGIDPWTKTDIKNFFTSQTYSFTKTVGLAKFLYYL